MRRVLVAFLGLTLALPASAGWAQPKKVKVGVIKLTSSAPVFVGVEKGFSREAGVEPELVYFQAAQPVAVAIAAGEIEAGATGLTAGLYNIVTGGQKVWVVADKGREWPGYPLTALVVQKDGPIQSGPDIARQLAWYHKAAMITIALSPRDLVDTSFLEEALRALPR